MILPAVLKLFIFILILSFPSYTFCQENEDSISTFGIRACIGFSAPIGQFAKLSKDGGFANSGFLASIESVDRLSSLFDLTFSLTYSTNKMNLMNLQKSLSPYRVNSGNYQTFWLLTGFQFGPGESGGTRIFLNGNIGFLYTAFPTITLEYGGTTIEGHADPNVGFAIGFGAGAQLYKINFGLRYMSGSIGYNQQETLRASFGGASTSLSVSILSLYVGVMF